MKQVSNQISSDHPNIPNILNIWPTLFCSPCTCILAGGDAQREPGLARPTQLCSSGEESLSSEHGRFIFLGRNFLNVTKSGQHVKKILFANIKERNVARWTRETVPPHRSLMCLKRTWKWWSTRPSSTHPPRWQPPTWLLVYNFFLQQDYFENFDGSQYLPRPWLRTVYPRD